MANKKFSEFTLKTDPANVDFLVGYDGTDNVRIDPSNLGGGGASDLNGLSDCLVDTLSLYVGESPSSLSGNPQGNTTVGIDAGNALTTGHSSTLIGSEAGLLLTTQVLNTYVGHRAGAGQIGSSNTALGWRALESTTAGNRTGQRNIAVGFGAFRYGISGERNTAVGYYASAFSVLSGNNNTLIGNEAGVSSTSVSNEITLGNSSVTSLRCAVTSITSLSDERDKSDIKDLEYGLAFIDALQPREFVWDNRPETRIETDDEGNETEVEFYSANKGKKDFGFIAQEVRELDNDTLRLVYAENEDKLEMSYGKLVPILVKAVQELKAEVELLKG